MVSHQHRPELSNSEALSFPSSFLELEEKKYNLLGLEGS